MKYHSTIGTLAFMKKLGFGTAMSFAEDEGSSFHDLDEVISSPDSEWKRPWWVRSVDKPTMEVDWDRMQRFDGRKMEQVSYREYIGSERFDRLSREREEQIRDWILENRSGYTLKDRALDLAGRTGSVKTSFLGSWNTSTKVGVWAGNIKSPEELGVPKYEGSPEENALMIRAALRHFGADQVGFLELDQNIRKLIYSFDAQDGKALVFENIDKAYETEKKRVIPEKAKWVIVLSIQMSEEQVKLMNGSAPSPVASSATGLVYARAGNIMDRLQNFLHVLGYQGLMGTWYNGLGIAPALGVMSGLGEMGRMNRLVSPEYGPLQRVYKLVTDLPLAPTGPIDAGIMRFCRTCMKCAETCPSGALSMDSEPSWEIKGPWNNPGPRAYFDEAPKCHIHWLVSTASCAKCFAICPFSNKDKSFIHKLVMSTLSVTPVMNKFLILMHDVFGYGAPRKPESWWELDLPSYGIDTTRAKEIGRTSHIVHL